MDPRDRKLPERLRERTLARFIARTPVKLEMKMLAQVDTRGESAEPLLVVSADLASFARSIRDILIAGASRGERDPLAG